MTSPRARRRFTRPWSCGPTILRLGLYMNPPFRQQARTIEKSPAKQQELIKKAEEVTRGR